MKTNETHPYRAGCGAVPAITSGFLALGAMAAQASTDYGPAAWNPLPNYYTSGSGHKFHVVHDMEGYYHSVYTVLKNQGLSVHYATNGKKDSSTDANSGAISQFVRDAHYGIHARCWNTHSTGTEHEGFASNPAWFTEEQYVASAGITAHLSAVFGWAKDRNHVVGHNAKSSSAWVSYASSSLGVDGTCNTHSDPGPYWDWTHYMALVNGGGIAPGGASAGQRMKGDFNGDGKDDIAVAYNYGGLHTGLWMFASSGSSFSSASLWWETLNSFDASLAQWTAGDFNGDGKSDVACLYDYGSGTSKFWVFLSTGSSFSAPVLWWSSSVGGFSATSSKIVAGDFNADGKCDIAVGYDYGGLHTGVWVFKSSGMAFTPTLWWETLNSFAAASAKWTSGDYNGDGKTDVGALYDYGNSTTKLWVFPSTGTGFGTLTLWWSSAAGAFDWGKSTVMSGDFNADGKKDIAVGYNNGGNATALWTFSSNGSAFTPAAWWSTSNSFDSNLSKWVAGDFTGDGKTDIGSLYNYGGATSKLWVFPSTGTSFSNLILWWSSATGGFDWTRSTAF
jgi:hypothetical protein